MTPENIEKAVRRILDTPFWMPSLETSEPYFRTHDDCDGKINEGIAVQFSCDGDAWIHNISGHGAPSRFRMPFIGGGRSPRVRSALMILALAIKLDNDGDVPEGKDEA